MLDAGVLRVGVASGVPVGGIGYYLSGRVRISSTTLSASVKSVP